MPKIVFFDPLQHFYDRHSIYSLSSFLSQNGMDVLYVAEKSPQKAAKKIARLAPDLILYSAFSSSIPIFLEFDRVIKKEVRALSLIGGPGPTFDWKCTENSTIDAVCAGEGELVLLEFVRSGFKAGKNIFYRGGEPGGFHPLVELDKLPFPDRDIVYRADPLLGNMPAKQFLSGRGCPYRCTYCFNHKFNEMFKDCGPVVRKKSVDYLLEEIRGVRKKYPLKNAVFVDDTFIIDKKWFREFCDRFPKETGLTYTCNIRANLIDEDTVKALADSRCIGTNWSIESGDVHFRNDILKRGMSNDEIENTYRLLSKYGIPYRIGNLIGAPGERLTEMFKTLELNIKARPYLGLANIFVPFPGLELTQYAISRGHYTPAPNAALPKTFFVGSLMNVSYHKNRMIQKLMCLFPLFVSYPVLYENILLRKILFRIPRFISMSLYEMYFGFRMMQLYVKDAPFLQKCRIAIRYLTDPWR